MLWAVAGVGCVTAMRGDHDITIADVLTVTFVVTLVQIWELWVPLDIKWATVLVTVIVQQAGQGQRQSSARHKQ